MTVAQHCYLKAVLLESHAIVGPQPTSVLLTSNNNLDKMSTRQKAGSQSSAEIDAQNLVSTVHTMWSFKRVIRGRPINLRFLRSVKEFSFLLRFHGD